MTTHYDAQFYAEQARNSYRSAQVVLPIVLDLCRPASLVDVGCGVGTWLAAAQERGVAITLGLEGPWIRSVPPFRPGLDIRVQELEQPIRLATRFDLALCMEVAEHLTPQRAESLVGDLCRLADVVLFGAAIPGQAGTNHVNCQWQSYWADLFRRHDRFPLDPVRPAVWKHPDVRFWYQQNPILYVPAHRASLAPKPAILDLVHPEMIVRPDRSVRAVLREIPGALGRALRSRLG